MEQEFAKTIRETIIARIEAAEQRRLKAEQAALRLAMWQAQAPVYNTRTRGRKVNYSELDGDGLDDEDEEVSSRGRRSERNRGDRQIVEYTASGRMIKRPRTDGVDDPAQESRMKTEDEDEQSEEEMEWSVYSDKGETDYEDEADEEEEGEEEAYDLGDRSLVVTLKIPKDRLRAAITISDTIVVNGGPPPPQAGNNTERSPPSKQAYSQQQSRQSNIVPFRSPDQHSKPVPYGGAASPPLPIRPVQLSPRPVQRVGLPHQSPPQYPPVALPHQYPRPSPPSQSFQPQPYRPPTYAIAQFRPSSPPKQDPSPLLPPVQDIGLQQHNKGGPDHNLANDRPHVSPPRPFKPQPQFPQKPATDDTPGSAVSLTAIPNQSSIPHYSPSPTVSGPLNGTPLVNGIMSRNPANGVDNSGSKEPHNEESVSGITSLEHETKVD